MHASVLLDDLEVRLVQPGDVGELYTLQRACWVQEAQDNPDVEIPALGESLEDVVAWAARDHVLVARSAGRLVGAVRARARTTDRGTAWDIGRLMVAPDLHGRGLGRMLLGRIEAAAPADATSYELFTGAGSLRNQRMYKKAGYRLRGEAEPGVVRLTKRR
ncbi:GNAT family N-acetyltransferase [Nocardioides luti]|uniref:GNAT family N-acetyltransferase n=1 Tax=Nocardioides luti TaxID=2761101 RepID=UPI0031B5C88A